MAEALDPEKGDLAARNDDDEEPCCSTDDKKEKSGNRTKGTQRWMKLRTTVQLSGAISHTIQKSKPPLKREDSFLKRFSTRQIPELEETVDTGEDVGYSSEGTSSGLARFYKKQRRKRGKSPTVYTVVNPDGNLFFYWLLVVSSCVLYNLWTLIVRQAFPELQERVNRFWGCCDILADTVFLLDVGVQLRTGYLEQGLMVYDSKKLAGHYIKSRHFVLDLLALFPLELAQFNLGVKPMLRFPRFLKVYRVYNYYYIVESRTVYPNVWRVVNLIHILLILAHWFGCFYFLISEAEGFQGDWVYPYRPGEYATLSRKYLGSLYWSTLTLTTIGDLPTPETNADAGKPVRTQLSRGHKSRLLRVNSNTGYIFTIVSYLIGVFIFATIVGQVGNVITNRNANRLEFERLLDGAKTYMRHHKVPGGMKRRVLRWYDYSWSRGRIQGGGDINTALGLLPDKLKTELALHVNLSVLKKVTIFQECQPEFLHDLVLKMKAYIFTPGDMICRKGEVAREMFIIADGILEVMSENGRVLTTMKAGDFFGEIGILNLDGLNKRTADVRSVGYSELFSLSREDVLTAMKDYPEAQEILQSLGRKRLLEARNMNRAWRLSAQQKKEAKNGAPNTPKQERLEIEGGEGTSKSSTSIVGKLKDVKDLRNVFKKSTRTARVKSDCVEIEMARCHVEKEKEVFATKGQLSRATCAYDADTSHDEDSQSSQKPLGAGLPLMQRLKLLKEKEREEQRTIGEVMAASMAPSTSDKKEADPALPLLQRILQLRPRDENKSESAVQSTANMTAEVLASTVRTQLKSPTTLTLKSTSKSESMFQKNKFGDVKTDVTSNEGHIKKEMEKRNTSECDNESWTLIKKAVLDPNSSFDTFEKKNNGTKKHDAGHTSISEVFNRCIAIKEKTLSVINSVTESSAENSTNQTLENIDLTDANEKLPKKHPRETPDRFSRYRDTDNLMVHSDDEVGHRSSLAKSSATKMYKRRKIYHSIDDLSPEYSGLPFVKKLKILNERQKLAELEKEMASDNVPEKYRFYKTTDSLASQVQTDKNVGSKQRGKELRLDIRETTELKKTSCVSSNISVEGKNTESLETANPKDTDLPLLSPESNETLERRKLKSILKKLSTVSTTNSSAGAQVDGSETGKKSTAEIRKLLRAPTVQGYAARHSKFTKSVTLHHNTVDDASSMDESQTESLSFFDENTHRAHSWDNLTGQTKYSTWTDSSRSFDDSQLTEISTFDNSAHAVHTRQEKTQKGEYFSSKNEDTVKSKEIDKIVCGTDQPVGVDALPKAMFAHLFSEIRQAIDDHMVQIECNYIHKYAKLEYDYNKREETISELQKKIEDLENEAIEEAEAEEERLRREESDSEDDGEVTHRGLPIPIYPIPPEELGHVEFESSDEDDDDEESSDEESDVFHNDWEVRLLAEELERREEASRGRAVSFDLSQLGPGREDRRARWSSLSEPPTYITQRSVSAHNLQFRFPRTTHSSFNGAHTSFYPTERLIKPASFSSGFR